MTMQSGRVSGNPARQTKTYDSLLAIPEGHRRELVYVDARSVRRAITRATAIGAVSGAIVMLVITLAYAAFVPVAIR